MYASKVERISLQRMSFVLMVEVLTIALLLLLIVYVSNNFVLGCNIGSFGDGGGTAVVENIYFKVCNNYVIKLLPFFLIITMYLYY